MGKKWFKRENIFLTCANFRKNYYSIFFRCFHDTFLTPNVSPFVIVASFESVPLNEMAKNIR